MSYSHDMSQETKPNVKKLLPVGWRKFQIKACKEATSKAGNPQFIFRIMDVDTQYEEDIYAISTPGKRWFLKSILESVGCEAGQDGKYNWDIPDVLDKEFLGLIIHEPNTYINRAGEEIHNQQHKITDVKSIDVHPKSATEVQWDA